MKKILLSGLIVLVLSSCTTIAPDATQPLAIPELIDSRIQNSIDIDINY
jgi:hypothetical protein